MGWELYTKMKSCNIIYGKKIHFFESTKMERPKTGSRNSQEEEATNHRLKRDEAAVRNQDTKAIAADSWYRPQNLGGLYAPSKWTRRSTTLALAQAAASDNIAKTCTKVHRRKHIVSINSKPSAVCRCKLIHTQSPMTTITITPGRRKGHPMKIE